MSLSHTHCRLRLFRFMFEVIRLGLSVVSSTAFRTSVVVPKKMNVMKHITVRFQMLTEKKTQGILRGRLHVDCIFVFRLWMDCQLDALGLALFGCTLFFFSYTHCARCAPSHELFDLFDSISEISNELRFNQNRFCRTFMIGSLLTTLIVSVALAYRHTFSYTHPFFVVKRLILWLVFSFASLIRQWRYFLLSQPTNQPSSQYWIDV